MVNLQNPYSIQKPPLKLFISVPFLYLAGYLLSKYTNIYFIYQFSISVLLSVVIAIFFDKDILSSDRFFSDKFLQLDMIFVLLTPVAAAGGLYLVSRHLAGYPLLHTVFSSGSKIPNPELFVMMTAVFVPVTEIFFRGFLQFNLMRLTGDIAGSVIAALIFGVFFMFAGVHWLTPVCIGLGLYSSFIYCKYRSVITNIIINVIIIILMFAIRF
jgi:membrane protease YdiL (CAAX protease family)